VPHIPGNYSHFVYGVIQSGITSAVATGITCLPQSTFRYWAISWLLSWAAMIPVVFCLAPVIRKIVDRITVN
jgi:Protein of unknown function (DUF2798)